MNKAKKSNFDRVNNKKYSNLIYLFLISSLSFYKSKEALLEA